MSAFSTSETRDPNGSTASVARFTTSKHSSQVPSSSVNIHDVRCGRPESRTIFTAAATASETEPSARPLPDGATENATITERPPVGVQAEAEGPGCPLDPTIDGVQTGERLAGRY